MKSSKWMFGLAVAVLMLALAPNSFAQLNPGVQLSIFNATSPTEQLTNRNAQVSDPNSPGFGILIQGAVSAVAGSFTLTTTSLVLTFPAPITSTPALLKRPFTQPVGTPTTSGDAHTGGPGNGGTTFVPLIVMSGSTPALAEVPPGDGIRISNATGLFAFAGISTITFGPGNGTITIILPGLPATVNGLPNPDIASGSFQLNGVRIDVAGRTAPFNLTAALVSGCTSTPCGTLGEQNIPQPYGGALNGNYDPPPQVPTLIGALGPMGTLSVGTLLGVPDLRTAVVLTTQTIPTPAKATASFVLTEGFPSAWRSAVQLSASAPPVPTPNSTQVRLQIAGLPTGMFASFTQVRDQNSPVVFPANTGAFPTTCAAPPAPGGGVEPGASFVLSSITTSQIVSFAATNLNAVEQLAYYVCFNGLPTVPLLPGPITITATPAPIVNSGNNGIFRTTAVNNGATQVISSTFAYPTSTGGYPRFNQSDVGPLAIAAIIEAKTTMLLEYGTFSSVFDNGVTVSNTTLDTITPPFGGATAASGSIKFSFFPRTAGGVGTTREVDTSAAAFPKGSNGLLAGGSGKLEAGGTFSMLLSDIWIAAGGSGDFTGYIIIQANFLNAHGIYYVLTKPAFSVTAALPLGVMPSLAITGRNGVDELLGF